MPRVTGVHKDRKGRYYFKAATGYDPSTGTYGQVTRRGFISAAEAAEARAAFLSERMAPPPSPVALLSVAELVERYLEECEASNRLGPKTLFDYRHYLEDYIRPWIGELAVGDVDAEVIASWQHTLAERGGTKSGRGLGPNTIRLARARLNAERLGHADPTLFIKLYSHVTPSMQQQAAARLGATLLGDSY